MRVFVNYKDTINSFDVTKEDMDLIEKVKSVKPNVLDMIKVNSQDEWFVISKHEDALFLLDLILRKDISKLFDDVIESSNDEECDSDCDLNIDILRPVRKID